MNDNALGKQELGSVVNIGDKEFIVVEHFGNGTGLVLKNNATRLSFGDTADYRQSNVRKYCVEDFYQELSCLVGTDHIIRHTVDLMAEDGTFYDNIIYDTISILTLDRYGKYRRYISIGENFWTATRVTESDSCKRYVCYVGSDGVLGWEVCGICRGVRPFCILDSCLLINR